jgi:hypothetical protein
MVRGLGCTSLAVLKMLCADAAPAAGLLCKETGQDHMDWLYMQQSYALGAAPDMLYVQLLHTC